MAAYSPPSSAEITAETATTKPLHVYAAELRHWLHLTQQCQLSNFYYMNQMMCQSLDPRNYTRDSNSNVILNQPATTHLGHSHNQNASPPRTFPLSAGTEVRIPRVWKRAVAEVIDFVVLLMVKFFISYIMISFGGMTSLEILDFDYALFVGELDLDKFYSLSSEILLVEFVHRILVSFYEAFCLAYVRDVLQPANVGGFTPGKRIMGICVISCDEVFSLGNERFLVTQISHPNFYRTLMRSLIKNFSVSLLVPSCLTVFMFNHHRTIYDIVTNTVVIEQDYGALIADQRPR